MRKALICPTKYVQGEDELLNLGYFVKTFGKSALLIAHPDDINRVKDKLDKTCDKFNITLVGALAITVVSISTTLGLCLKYA